MDKYIGKSVKTNEWITASNIIRDPKRGDTYIIPDLFNLETLNLNKKQLNKYKVDNSSVGVAIGADKGGQTIYSGDIVRISYYGRKPLNNKRQTAVATVIFDKDAKIYYMKSGEGVFLFDGDAQHLISSISRVGRAED